METQYEIEVQGRTKFEGIRDKYSKGLQNLVDGIQPKHLPLDAGSCYLYGQHGMIYYHVAVDYANRGNGCCEKRQINFSASGTAENLEPSDKLLENLARLMKQIKKESKKNGKKNNCSKCKCKNQRN